MEFIELAKKRYSVRRFKGTPVEPDKVDTILEAGRIAPTACNNQPQRILILDDHASLEKVKACTRYHFNAPLMLVVCYDSHASWKRSDGMEYGPVDVSINVAQMMLEAVELDLGSTFVGAFDAAALREAFAIPQHIVPVALLPIGYPADESEPGFMHESRLDVSETVFRGAYPSAGRS